MAAQERTEKPTAKRRNEARRKGQVANSAELNHVVVLIAGLAAVLVLGRTIVSEAALTMQAAFALASSPHTVTSAAGLHGLLSLALGAVRSTLVPIAGICLAGALISNVAQVRLRPAWSKLRPDFRHISPMGGFRRLFGRQIAFQLVQTLAKVAVVGGVAALALLPQITGVSAAVGTTPGALGSLMSSSALAIVERVAAVYLLIGLIDLIWSRRQHARSLKMTKQEVKEESKSTEAPPEVRAAIRRRQFQIMRARMMAAVPTADVVVTNPTHYAVALRYDGTLPAPVVVAKGRNLIAAQIRRIASEHGVPIVPDPPLARSLYSMVALEAMIPAELYAAVAQVLAYVYRMAGRRRVAA
ncbi:MAG TPA: flagellar biosynthesis protein FlhB [Solirubrobacteraceae bacterium]|nr:flagellar biosynthesis protein FlhB [Solirubrobacteraceae bacterium]